MIESLDVVIILAVSFLLFATPDVRAANMCDQSEPIKEGKVFDKYVVVADRDFGKTNFSIVEYNRRMYVSLNSITFVYTRNDVKRGHRGGPGFTVIIDPRNDNVIEKIYTR